MSVSSIYLHAGAPRNSLRFFSGLRSLGRRLSRVKLFHPLRSLARGVVYTAEPAGKLLINKIPTIPASKTCDTLTVISANLWHDWPQHRRLDQRLDDFIHMADGEDADILVLQEVARTSSLHADEYLARKLNMSYVYSRVNGHRKAIGFEEGLAILSRYPLRRPFLRHLNGSTNPFVRRLALGAAVDTPCGDLFAFSTHLSIAPKQNAAQVDQLHNWVTQIAGKDSAIIGGDFNAHEDRPQIKQVQRAWVDTFRKLNPGEDGVTHELKGPCGVIWRRHRLDYIFLHPGNQNWQVTETKHMHIPQAPHSDHRAVLTRLIPA